MARNSKTLDDLFHNTLKDMYDAEKQIVKALPKMIAAAASDDLREAFENHLEETNEQVKRLEQIFQSLDQPVRGKRCAAIRGILAEGDESIERFGDTAVGDDGLISSGQAVEHYEIARYGTLKRWAEELGLDDAVELLNATLLEEKAADEKLAQIEDRIASQSDDTRQSDDRGRNARPGAGRGQGRQSAGGRQRDDEGRFVSDDDRGADRGRSRDDDTSRRPYGEGSRGGRSRNDDERGSSRSSADYAGDTGQRRATGTRDDDERGSGRASSGRDYDDRQGGNPGWSGDPEGHSEAARRGWETRREEGDYGRSGSDSRNRPAYPNERSGSRDYDARQSGGQGGWFGDPEGHAEASRRGWENRSDEDDRRGSPSRNRSRDEQSYAGSYGRSDDDDNSRSSRSR